MKKNDSQKLLDHIDGAKDWLDKAKDEYNQSNPIGGELILNMAGAEIKYAWELSRSRYVVNHQKLPSNRKFKMILPVAASITVLLGLVFWLKSNEFYIDRSHLASVRNDKTIVLQESSLNNQNTAINDKSLVATSKPSGKLKPENEIASLKTESQTVNRSKDPERNPGKMGNTVVANQTRVSDQTSAQPNIQPVSQFLIDEEALTKEASHSLRNGK
jgi:hypothetical protein